MTPSVVVISQPRIDFDTFVGLTHQMLGYSPASAVDQSRLQHSDSERFISCLAALRDRNAPAGLPVQRPNLLSFVSFSLLIAADDRDMLDIMECCAGMPAALADTVQRGVVAAVISGELRQWQDAVETGCNATMEHNVRVCFNSVLNQLTGLGLNVWKHLHTGQMQDRTFYLEDKRR